MTLISSKIRFLSTSVKRPLRCFRGASKWPRLARQEVWRDMFSRTGDDIDVSKAIGYGLDWLSLAQDNSTSTDGGVARHYSLLSGWASSYPETTGYIIPTFLEHARRRNDPSLSKRAHRMLEWLLSIQLKNGSFQGGTIGTSKIVPVTFDTGQILIGLSAGVAEFGDVYRPALVKAANWLLVMQDEDGCWRNPNPYVCQQSERVYETHVAWGLLEAARIEPNHHFEEAGLRNIHWALKHQESNGWLANCCLSDPLAPLTHTIGYAFRGILEGWRFSQDERLLRSSILMANGLLQSFNSVGRIPGRLNSNWKGTVRWSCLTGSAQIAICWLMLYEKTGDERYRDAAFLVNRYVRQTLKSTGSVEMVGGVKGAFPVFGDYGRFELLNWACKFMIDANTLEEDIRKNES